MKKDSRNDSNIQETLAEEFDALLLKMLREGKPQLDNDGNVINVPLSAADLNVIRQRLKDCGITAIPAGENPIEQIIQEMRSRGLKLHGSEEVA